MKKMFVMISILVVVSLFAVAFGMDRQTTALAQGGQPPITLPEDRGGSSADQASQGGNFNAEDGQALDGSINSDYPMRQMSYQGKLVQNGVPYDGMIDITFGLYWEEIGSTAVWTETQTVSVDNGLFSVMLGSVTPLPVAQQFLYQMYLGIQPDGAASELTPRQPLGVVGAAMNVIPGATMVDTNPAGSYGYSFYVYSQEHQGIYGSTVYTDGVGVFGGSFGAYGGGSEDPIGVLGVSYDGLGVSGVSDYIGVKGQGNYGVYGTTNGMFNTAVYGYTDVYSYSQAVYGLTVGDYSYGVIGYSLGLDSPGVYGLALGNDEDCPPGDTFCLGGVVAQSFGDAYGLYSYSDQRAAVLGDNNDSGFFAGYFANFTGTSNPGLGVEGYASIDGDLFVSGSKAGYVVDIAFNAGSEPLQQGDVVVVVGADAPILGNIPVMRVQKATLETAYGVVGVVDVLYEKCEKSPEELQAGEACGRFNHDATTIQPGQYVGVVTLGAFAYLKVDASTGAIKAGDLLSVSPVAGMAAKATMITVDGASFFAPGTIIGKALSGLESGSGLIPVFVSIR